MKTILTVLAALTCTTALGTTAAVAQYYDRQYERPPGYDQDRPPPGFYPDRDRSPGYDRDREQYDQDRERRREGRDRYRGRRVALGSHCEAFIRTGYGPQRLFCPIVRAKPIGEDCACPAPREGPGDPDGSYVGGRTVP